MDRESILRLKNKIIRKESQDAYVKALHFCNESVIERQSTIFKKRKELVEYAYNHCQFYKSLYDKAGFHPSQLKTEKDWQFVPILEKQMIRDHADDIIVTSGVDLSPSGLCIMQGRLTECVDDIRKSNWGI